ncbi:MAG TPA: carboxymuconolactone decarboxylase family protein [Methylomirabilota bacterium]|nr:carboxymuconolactone decarboxylase family protein [Methylomirabilota bacterium]
MYDMKMLARLDSVGERAPATMAAFGRFADAAMSAGALPVKTKELIAVAVAHVTQCIYCLELHVGKARKAGATDEELVEAAFVAATIRAGGALMHMTHICKG